ncbi:MotA/TolQ/ExbB proton channel family protein [Ectothiorhodospiraceae bacterium WFHF3C12]|nr:MotA/TolQ/ExbB proton channel family protein [Ectothiorhodospiraceae bacterium WFHF3C12]
MDAVTESAQMPMLAGLQALLNNGGPVVAILLAMSVLALAIVLLKLWQFLRLGLHRVGFIAPALDAWRGGDGEGALKALDGQPNPIARVLAIAMGGIRRQEPEYQVREEASRVAVGHIEQLRSNLRLLEIIATLSPLLGLLGTVLGMIEAFQKLEGAGAGQVDPAVLSGGIWEALLTTAVGLAVAIPATAALSLFERAVERFKHRLEDALTRVFTGTAPDRAGAAAELRVAERRAADAH